MAELCFVLSCHERVRELLAHLDILKFCPISHKIIIIHSGARAIKPELMAGCQYVRVDAQGYGAGALAAFLLGIQEARKTDCRFMCFRNGDDWLLNHEVVEARCRALRSGYHLVAYNWLTYRTFFDFALNEIYLDLEAFGVLNIPNCLKACAAQKHRACEINLAAVVRRIARSRHFLRSGEREIPGGIAWFLKENLAAPNTRWFNRKWQMIGAHSASLRMGHYFLVQPKVPYAKELEQLPYFGYWLTHTPAVPRRRRFPR